MRLKIDNTKTKKYLLDNIRELSNYFAMSAIDYSDLPVIKDLFEKTKILEEFLSNSKEKNVFFAFGKDNLLELKSLIDNILDEKYENLKKLQDLICQTIEDLMKNSKQRFFHHNIDKKNTKGGCWIRRGERTISNMWNDQYQPKLVICDEVQRLGSIPKGYSYDEFDEIQEIVCHSEQSFFTGDNFQMLNSKYDRGIIEIDKVVKENHQQLIKLKLPESVGVPPEIGLLMKYFTHPGSINIAELVDKWQTKLNFEIIFIKNDVAKLVDIFDNDSSNKRHFAAPMDSLWLRNNNKIQIQTSKRARPIISLRDHEKEKFAYKFPYFCNEEIMPNYILSAYELISREVESLYVHIPNFSNGQPIENKWYKNHLYVLLTRATMRLVVNFENDNEFERMIKLVINIKSKGAKVSVDFIH